MITMTRTRLRPEVKEKWLAADLRERGHDIPEPDHTAAGDVATTRAVFDALRAEAEQ